LKCNSPCQQCFGVSSNCTVCQVLNNTNYYLYNSNYGTSNYFSGSCLTVCTGAFYAYNSNLTCLPCNLGCALCSVTSSNCSSCNADSTQNPAVQYFKQPTGNVCSMTCPSRYFKFSDNTCSKCTVSGFGDWIPADPNTFTPQTAECSSSCNVACNQCFNNTQYGCINCANSYFLQP
jgi:proprotein convertase subtilisin/kexin type 5